MQGWRSSNEDAHVTAINVEPGISIFAVFDGHGGCEVAKYCENHIIKELKANKDYQNRNYEKALTDVYLKIDKMLLSNDSKASLNPTRKTRVECRPCRREISLSLQAALRTSSLSRQPISIVPTLATQEASSVRRVNHSTCRVTISPTCQLSAHALLLPATTWRIVVLMVLSLLVAR